MESKTPIIFKLKKELTKYFIKHNLDPSKDYTNDKVHGNYISDLVFRLNRERDKLQRDKIYGDIPNKYKKLIMATKKKESKALSQGLKKVKEVDVKSKAEKIKKKSVAEDAAKAKEEAKAKTKKTNSNLKYDYPLVDGREMTSAEKKKYRSNMRKEANKETEAPKAKKVKEEKPAKTEKVKKVKKSKTSKVED